MAKPFSLDDEFDDPEEEELAGKIKFLKELLNDPPRSMWDYEMLESIIIQYEETGVISKKQIERIEDAYDRYYDADSET